MRRVIKYSRAKVALIALCTAALAGAAGWYSGRMALEKEWSAGAQPLTQIQVEHLSKDDADPVPKAGTLVLAEKPYIRSVREMAEATRTDTVKVRIAAIGNGDDGAELHVDVENHAKCTLTEVGGVIHGFDATGAAAQLNVHGEHFVAFSVNEQNIEPGAHAMLAQKLRYPETASLAVARVDSYVCADGTSWVRQ